MLTNSEVILRILLAGVLGSVVGLEREYQNQPAGLRTHIILVIGACLAMVLSINSPMIFSSNPIGDPGRIAAQVISGIGFLGAGAILRYGAQIKGLTTAASMWTMAVVGLCVGAGYFFPAVATTAILLVVLTLINLLEENLIQPFITIQLSLKADDRPGLLKEIKKVVSVYSDSNYESTSFSVKKNMEEQRIGIEINIRTRDHAALDTLIEDIADIDGVRSFEIA
ncbi:MAG: MgtC/SapB family protein [Anaerolineae bacterium]|jgi:putative Mg2+ transporter-C (MgtC) family protein|nr:MgtC/SapB family protein [Anaerolineae bacterium]